jgi:hypothetical protein
MEQALAALLSYSSCFSLYDSWAAVTSALFCGSWRRALEDGPLCGTGIGGVGAFSMPWTIF